MTYLTRTADEKDPGKPPRKPLRILVVSICLPKPDTSAGDRRFVALLGLLSRHNEVDLYYHKWDDSYEVARRYETILRDQGIRLLPIDAWRAFDRAIHRKCYDVGWFEYWGTAESFADVFRKCQPWAKVIVDTGDVHFLREQLGVALGRFNEVDVAANKSRELEVYRKADSVIVITEEDQAGLQAYPPMPFLHLIPIIVPLQERVRKNRAAELLFVGGFSHPPNVDGLLWFIQDVWPSIRIECPEVLLTVVGTNPPEAVQALDRQNGVRVLGYVPETAPFLDRAAISIAPLRYGAGMKGKVCEAMAAGLPVVTTSIGAQGLHARPGEDLLIADSAAEFARSVVALLRFPEQAEKIGQSGQQLIAKICSPEAAKNCIDILENKLRATVAAPRRSLMWWVNSVYLHAGWILRLPLKLPGSRPAMHFLRARLQGS